MTDPRLPPETRVPVDPPPGRGSQNTLFFIVGALVVLVGIIAYVMFGTDRDTNPGTTGTTIEEPATNTDTNTTTDTDTTQ